MIIRDFWKGTTLVSVPLQIERSTEEEILRASGVQVVEFRASIVIGSGSLSFEMIRSLVLRRIKLFRKRK